LRIISWKEDFGMCEFHFSIARSERIITDGLLKLNKWTTDIRDGCLRYQFSSNTGENNAG
jgi:hypothetical protein